MLGRWQLHAGTAGLRQADSDGLLGRSRAVLAFADMVHFLAYEFACLGARRLAFALVLLGAFERFLVGHVLSFSDRDK